MKIEMGESLLYSWLRHVKDCQIYGDNHSDTVMAVIKKCLRTAMCLRGYLNAEKAEIIFASPKINPKEMRTLPQCIDEMNVLFSEHGLQYHVRLLANEDFSVNILQPVLELSKDVSDTSELFLRGYQLFQKVFTEINVVIEKYFKEANMNEGQTKFFEFIMACAKEECRDKAKALLAESFERQSSGRFDLPFLAKFNEEIRDYIREDKLDEVMAVLSKFGKMHLS